MRVRFHRHWLGLASVTSIVLAATVTGFPQVARAQVVRIPLPLEVLSAKITVGVQGAVPTAEAEEDGAEVTLGAPIVVDSQTIGQVIASASVEGSVIRTTVNGATFDVVPGDFPGDSTRVVARASIRVRIHVPQVGDALTPLFTRANIVRSSGAPGVFGLSQMDSRSPRDSSVVLGAPLFVRGDLASVGVRDGQAFGAEARIAVLPAGDTIETAIAAEVTLTLPEDETGAFDAVLEVRLDTVEPVLGSGDVSGDGAVDLVDVTILRRRLVGAAVERP